MSLHLGIYFLPSKQSRCYNYHSGFSLFVPSLKTRVFCFLSTLRELYRFSSEKSLFFCLFLFFACFCLPLLPAFNSLLTFGVNFGVFTLLSSIPPLKHGGKLFLGFFFIVRNFYSANPLLLSCDLGSRH